MSKITINGISIDPEVHGSMLAAANLIKPDSSSSNYILIQTNQPLNGAQRKELEGLGVVILEYVPESTYICQYFPADLNRIRALPYVAWTNIYLDGFKVGPVLRTGAAGPKTASLLTAPPVDTQSKDSVTVDVVLHKQVTSESVRDKIAAVAGLNPAAIKDGSNKIRLTVQRRRLRDLAAIDEVRHIEPYVPPKLANNIARGIMGADTVQGAGSLAGDGPIAPVADTGFDTASTTDLHPAVTTRVFNL